MCYSEVLQPGRWSVSARAVSVSCGILLIQFLRGVSSEIACPCARVAFPHLPSGVGVLLDSRPPHASGAPAHSAPWLLAGSPEGAVFFRKGGSSVGSHASSSEVFVGMVVQ